MQYVSNLLKIVCNKAEEHQTRDIVVTSLILHHCTHCTSLWHSILSATAAKCQKLKIVGYTSMAKCKALTGSVVKGLKEVCENVQSIDSHLNYC